MKELINKLLKGEIIELRKDLVNNLPDENEKIWAYTEAEILEGEVHKVIQINISWTAQKISNPEDEEIYDAEPMYRLPYTKDKKLLEKMLTLVKKQSHSYNANRV